MSENTGEENAYKVKQYLITPPAGQKKAVYNVLADFVPHMFEHVPYLAVTVRNKDEELSLVKLLETLPDVTYRESLKRSIDDTVHEANGGNHD